MVSLEAISEAVPGSYLIANEIFHIFGECLIHALAMAMAARTRVKWRGATLTTAALATWLTVTWTLASSGYWHNKEQHAYDWTRFSFHATGASAGFTLVAVSERVSYAGWCVLSRHPAHNSGRSTSR